MRQSSLPHVPSIDVSHSIDFTAYCQGLSHGQCGKVFDPLHDYQPSERAAYEAGFTRARQEPRANSRT